MTYRKLCFWMLVSLGTSSGTSSGTFAGCFVQSRSQSFCACASGHGKFSSKPSQRLSTLFFSCSLCAGRPAFRQVDVQTRLPSTFLLSISSSRRPGCHFPFAVLTKSTFDMAPTRRGKPKLSIKSREAAIAEQPPRPAEGMPYSSILKGYSGHARSPPSLSRPYTQFAPSV